MNNPIGQVFITMNTVINSSSLVETGELTVGNFLDLCALTETVCLNEKMYFIPMFSEETDEYVDQSLFRQLLDEGVLSQFLLNDQEEDKLSALITMQFSKCKSDELSQDDLFYKIGKVMKEAKQYRSALYNQLYGKPYPISPTRYFKKLEDSSHDDITLYMLGRVFMYYILAGEKKMGFCPDYVRIPILGDFFQRQYASLPQEIYNLLARNWNTDIEKVMEFGNQNILPIPPLGIVLLKRCKGSRRSIPEAIMDLREECKSLRKHCIDLELDLLLGSFSESRKALGAIEKLSKNINTKYSTYMDDRLLYRTLKFSKKVVEYLLDPKKLLSIKIDDLIEWWNNRTTNQFLKIAKKASRINDTNRLLKNIFNKEFSDTDISKLKKFTKDYSLPAIKFKNILPPNLQN